ncbi:hypothetical protein L248_0685 [Schleiferilactobacillus shenzhenensis LY-73]|uniref:Uncharacterized protein n=2 Tax=Schleiferilactobacillus shenzhenensis TaxID=1231337 RepID=U4TIW9_9LACO|nr:hypothetical protein L248_0685 [Schleiferilactobacillus shenzhenensis LY-73]
MGKNPLPGTESQKKVHYRLYKSKKQWLVASIAALTLGMGSLALPTAVKAADIDGNDGVTTAEKDKAAADTKPEESQDQSATDSKQTVSVTIPAVDQSKPELTTGTTQDTQKPVVTETESANTAKTDNASQPNQDTTMNDAKKTAQSTASVDSATTNQEPSTEKKTLQSEATKKTTSSIKADEPAQVKATRSLLGDSAVPKEAADAYNTAKDKADDANKSADENNAAASDAETIVNNDNGKALTTDEQKALQKALDDLKAKLAEFQGKQTDTDAAIQAYEDVLKKLPNQPAAIKDIIPNPNNDPLTLDTYNTPIIHEGGENG